jgi:hypothetical protein
MSDVEYDTGHFLYMAAKDICIRTHGPKMKDWPEENFYAYISTVKMSITREQVPKLMKQAKVTRLLRFDEYFPMENTDEKVPSIN